jgi:hypothetical protein
MGAIVIRTRYDEGTESAEVATSAFKGEITHVKRIILESKSEMCKWFIVTIKTANVSH